MQNRSFSWGIVILLFVLFFPVGIWMLVKKMSVETDRRLENGKYLRIFGWVLAALGVIYAAICISSAATTGNMGFIGTMTVALLLFDGGGLFMVYKGGWYIRLENTCRRYSGLIQGEATPLDAVAAGSGRPYDQVVGDLNELLKAGYYPGAQLDLQKRQLRLPAVWAPQATAFTPYTVKCPGCRAQNLVSSPDKTACDYCGAPLPRP